MVHIKHHFSTMSLYDVTVGVWCAMSATIPYTVIPRLASDPANEFFG